MTLIKHNPITGEMYLTRHDTEFLGLPVGNAFSGAPFKQKEMPFFIAPEIGAAATAVGAAVAGGVFFSAATAVAAGAVISAIGTVAMVAGTAMTVVGAVTGDKELMKWGGIVGLAGGVGALAGGGIASVAAGSSFGFGTSGVQAANTAMAQTASSAGTGTLSTAAGGIASQVDKALPAMNLTEKGATLTTQGISNGGNGILASGADKILGSGTQFSSYIAPEVVTNGVAAPLAGSTSTFGNLAGTGAAETLAKGTSSALALGGEAAKDTSFFGSMFSGMSGSDKVTALSGAATLLGKAFGDNSNDAVIKKAQIESDAKIKTAEMEVGVADRKLAAEKELNAQKFANMDYQPTFTWEVGNKSTGMTKTLGSGSRLASQQTVPAAAKGGK